MNIDDLTVGQAKQLAAQFGGAPPGHVDNDMIGEFVIVRCRDAGVHAGILKSQSGRECVLTSARRLWYWMPANGAAFLSGVATEGLHEDSKIGASVEVRLTENCEIIRCTDKARVSISSAPDYKP